MPRTTLVLIAVLVLLTSVLAACGGGSEPEPAATTSTTAAPSTTMAVTSTSTSESTSTPTSTALAAFDPGSLSRGWDFKEVVLELSPEVEIPPGFEVIHGFAASTDGMVLLGKLDSTTPTFRRPAVWFSTDGESWQQVGTDVFVTAEVNQVVAGGPGFVAVGSDCAGPAPDRCNADPAIWTSPDGQSWQRVPHDPTIFPGCLDQGGHEVHPYLEVRLAGCTNGDYRPTIEHVSATDDGLLAVGYDPTWTALWYSPDGLAWTRVDHSETPKHLEGNSQGWTLYADNPGVWTELGMVLPGFRCTDRLENDKYFTDCIGDIWTSLDGVSWTAKPWSDDLCNEWQPASTVEFRGEVIVAGNRADDCSFCPFGYEPEPSAIVALHSKDGIEWQQATIPSPEVGRVWAGSLITAPLGLIAMAENEDEPTLAAMWHSEDGLAWEVVPALSNSPPSLWPYHVIWVDNQLILQGTAMSEGERVVVLGRWSMP